MIIVCHRRNTLAELLDTPPHYGVEVDIRTYRGDLIVHHDPFVSGEPFEQWLSHYAHRLLILNVKEEGLEGRLLEHMQRQKIEDFFFLDQSFPFLVRTAKGGERRCAVRVSEFESVETALALAGSVDWVWIDCFTRYPLTPQNGRALKQAGFKLCLVSPELQGRTDGAEIRAMRRLLAEHGVQVDAVCTKLPELWVPPC